MANIFDYIDWRGDLDLTQDPFNEVDSLILSTVSYIDFELIETDLKTEKATIREAGEQFNRLHADEKTAFAEAKKHTDAPTIIEFMIATDELVLPMVKSGNPMSEMILK